jgi:hypothetical protein
MAGGGKPEHKPRGAERPEPRLSDCQFMKHGLKLCPVLPVYGRRDRRGSIHFVLATLYLTSLSYPGVL